MFANILLAAGIFLILYGLYRWIRINEHFFENRGIPHRKMFFIFGNIFRFFLSSCSLYDYVKMTYDEFPNARISGMFDMRQPFFVIRDPEILKQLCIKDFDHFEDHRQFVDESTDEMLGNSLLMLRGEKWRDMRATLSPAFTGSKMRQMFDLVRDCAIDMAKHFKDRAEKGENVNCEMKDIFSRYSNDVIATAAFGIHVNSFKDKENDFFKAGMRFSNPNVPVSIAKLLLILIMPKVTKLFNVELIDKKLKRFLYSMVMENMKSRDEKNIFRPDMINILMQVKKGHQNKNNYEEDKSMDGFATVEESNIGKMITKRKWTDIELVAQCLLFFIAGFETSSTALSFLFYELAVNADVQEKLYKECVETNKILNEGPLNYDTVQKMKYMDMVISEALRKWPPAGVQDRVCVKDYNYDDGEIKFKFKKGFAFWIPIFGLHRDPKYFPDPEKFDPDRFNDDNKNNIVPYSYLPFGIGPRNCIGSRFALMEVKAIVYYLLLNFKFVPNSKTQIPVKLAKTPFAAKAEKGIELELVLR